MRFEYILDKIEQAGFSETPFRHVEIDELFTPDDFSEVVAAPEIAINDLESDDSLFQALAESGYRIIEFPGCVTNLRAYRKWRSGKAIAHDYTNTSCEGFGVTFRMVEALSPIISELKEVFESSAFEDVIAKKFDLDCSEVRYDCGIQKYLDGYEISPHPDIRSKALTYMVNINPDPMSEREDHHTHYLTLKQKFRYVEAFWEENQEFDRSWVPWHWCKSVKQQYRNNSMILFQPSEQTMHAVKARYNHLNYQRTQLYGNLWYRDRPQLPTPSWDDLWIRERHPGANTSVRGLISRMLPMGLKRPIKAIVRNARKGTYLDRDL